MPFSEERIESCWIRSRGKCDCIEDGHGHTFSCGHTLLKSDHGNRDSLFGWEAHSLSGVHLSTLVAR